MNPSRLVIALASILVAACSAETPSASQPGNGEANATAEEGGKDGDAKPSGEAAKADDSGDKASKSEASVGGCDEAGPASLPLLTSELVVSGAGKSAPAPKGGDEKGTWIVTKVTTYLPASAAVLVDVNASKGEGSGFVKFDGKRFLTFSDTTTTLSTRITGPVVSSAVSTVAGTYTYQNGKMTLNPECTETTAEQSGEPAKSMGFSRISDTEALFQQTGPSQIGEVTIVMTLKKAD